MIRLASLIALTAVTATAAAQQPAIKGLAVHEWGVFEVSEDAEFANAYMRAVWDDLPGFVYGHIKGRAVPQHWGAIELRNRPIIFFHADKPAQVRVKIDFPGGMAGSGIPRPKSRPSSGTKNSQK
jgi:hypothetical protein